MIRASSPDICNQLCTQWRADTVVTPTGKTPERPAFATSPRWRVHWECTDLSQTRVFPQRNNSGSKPPSEAPPASLTRDAVVAKVPVSVFLLKITGYERQIFSAQLPGPRQV